MHCLDLAIVAERHGKLASHKVAGLLRVEKNVLKGHRKRTKPPASFRYASIFSWLANIRSRFATEDVLCKAEQVFGMPRNFPRPLYFFYAAKSRKFFPCQFLSSASPKCANGKKRRGRQAGPRR